VKADPNEPKKKKSGYKNWFADIDNGRKILCFFAPGCDHCKETAKELTQLKKQITDFPEVKIVFMDEEADLIPDFFAYAGGKYPYQIADVASFWQSLGGTKDTPGVIYLWNGNVIKEYDGINEKQFKMNEFKTIVNKTYKDLK
jgi:thiol-disulfide isomerase/thioredoxin